MHYKPLNKTRFSPGCGLKYSDQVWKHTQWALRLIHIKSIQYKVTQRVLKNSRFGMHSIANVTHTIHIFLKTNCPDWLSLNSSNSLTQLTFWMRAEQISVMTERLIDLNTESLNKGWLKWFTNTRAAELGLACIQLQVWQIHKFFKTNK